jgi:hypothetical protein
VTSELVAVDAPVAVFGDGRHDVEAVRAVAIMAAPGPRTALVVDLDLQVVPSMSLRVDHEVATGLAGPAVNRRICGKLGRAQDGVVDGWAAIQDLGDMGPDHGDLPGEAWERAIV